ncbi:cytidine(32) 2-sulfurtransferase [Seminavis robusta]|uniref:Cytidine(32) 2-sulfurtransferase n=1 Tax=Seminavis robusta TaxID=568900 RepID=A0A9N8DVF2_9STRA|nr:cytidine(32) 2-sulfurtransferase [Seminavis robusta]|eukprot:Sro305_g112820.1 cytidine(32) 2-sulfurtransferase (1183) ;mRNA; r:54580-58514
MMGNPDFEKAIDTLRSEIAQDTQSKKNAAVTFTSPFKVPPGASSVPLGETIHPHSDSSFLQVPLVYCDQTASNRSLTSIEAYMEQTCRPLYGNTHTNTSITGAQSTAFLAEARQIVAEETNAKITGKASQDLVLFAGNGTTAAVELLIDCLGIKHACNNNNNSENNNQRPVVFIGPYEHHSNIIPWRESGAEIVMVPECPHHKTVDYKALEQQLQLPQYKERLKMGTFSAASNVTGKVSDVDRIADTLHRHGALAFFDYATAAPYMHMDMNPPPLTADKYTSSIAKDAIFFSPHKMIGGVGTPGVLVIKKHLVDQTNAPKRSGGGTVFYVTNTHHRFLSNRIERFEGGTPNVAGILRVGLAFLFKRQVEKQYQDIVATHKNKNKNKNNQLEDTCSKETDETTQKDRIPSSLQSHEYATYSHIANYLKKTAPNLVLLDSNNNNNNDDESPHLPILSFLIKCGNRFLHYNYVCAILNDVFGIQSRGGCQCAGPYSQRLLGLSKLTDSGRREEIPNDQNKAMEHALLHYKERAESLRPGYTRLSLPFKGLRSEEVQYVVDALVWVAKNGWALMCHYRCNHRTGEWRHANRQGKPLGKSERKWLSHYDRTSDALKKLTTDTLTPESNGIERVLRDALSNANCILNAARKDQNSIAQALKMQEVDERGSDALEQLRWFVKPNEIALHLSQGLKQVPGTFSAELVGGLRPVAAELYFTTKGEDERAVPSRVNDKTHVAADGDGEMSLQAAIPVNDVALVSADGSNSTRPRRMSNSKSLRPAKRPRTAATATPGSNPSSDVLRKVQNDGVQDVKNETRKPSRDNEKWGRGNFVQPLLDPASESKSSALKSKKPPPDGEAGNKQSKKKALRPPAKLMRLITQAVIQWHMLEEGDRLLLGLSGGKDSLSLLHCLLECQRKLPIKFTIEVCTIDPMTPSFDPSALIPYVESLGLKYHYIRDDIVTRANVAGKDGKTASSLCAYCARMKRGNLYTCARNNRCNKLVLAQHLDDCAESFLMSAMHNGSLRTMKAHYKIDAGDLAVIRPLIYCREGLMTAFAKSANLPIINENCPACFEEPKERARVKKLLSREESIYPNVLDNIRRSLIPLMHDDLSIILRNYTEEVVSRSRKPANGKKQKKGKSDDITLDVSKTAKESPLVATAATLPCLSDEELLLELARRKAAAAFPQGQD